MIDKWDVASELDSYRFDENFKISMEDIPAILFGILLELKKIGEGMK